ncbi:hypothetical protein PV387_42250 [Streptomyces sp. ME02-6987-2C]|uniref:hypothetical protein n=1 Tax=unclassified Streptomyces TaxID=2593676 RepID=UPI0029A354C7|nr:MULTISPECIES: hypothetical protein [unclassified Streptomyces]MDX3372503.1 hypothetical protein [Streptomyces sp. ME02-6987-2C]MDX3427272.1 hypothetical protein [Streptomyces sp. ME02-6985-2c]
MKLSMAGNGNRDHNTHQTVVWFKIWGVDDGGALALHDRVRSTVFQSWRAA